MPPRPTNSTENETMKTILALGLSALVAYGLCTSLARACGDMACELEWRMGFVNAADGEMECGQPKLSVAEQHEITKLILAHSTAYPVGQYDFHQLYAAQGHTTACLMALDVYYGKLPLTVPAAAEDDCESKGLVAVYPDRHGKGLVCMYAPE